MIEGKIFLLLLAIFTIVYSQGDETTQNTTSTTTPSSASGCQNGTRMGETDYYEDDDDYYEDYDFLGDYYNDDTVLVLGKREISNSRGKIEMKSPKRRRIPSSNNAEKMEESKKLERISAKETNNKSVNRPTRGGHRGHKHIKPIGDCLPEKVGHCLSINGTIEGVVQCNGQLDYCVDDCDCPGYQKCCYNSCGRTECLPSTVTVATGPPMSETVSEEVTTRGPQMNQ